jgi:predicted metalloprotease with PDZ domain
MRPALVIMLACAAGCTCDGRRDAGREAGAAKATTAVAHLPTPEADASATHADASTMPPDSNTTKPDVILVLAPTCEDVSDVPSGVAVSLSVPLAGRRVFRIANEVMGFAGTADLISDVVAEDRRGPLPLTRRVRDRVLELAPSRDALGPLTLRYRVRSIPTTADGPREGLRHDATGIGGLGEHFVVLPESTRRYRMRVEWASPQCPASTRGAGSSSFGDGTAVDTVGELAELRAGVYFHGRPQRIAVDDGSLHLRTAWFGEPALDMPAVAAWAARVLAAERAFFVDEDPGVYSMFVRVVRAQDDRSNGVGHQGSMLSAIGPRTTFGRRLKINIAHEMFHRWLGMRLRLRGPEGSNYWFTEGFTVHYANVLAFRAGLISVDELLEALNDIASRHFDNKRATATNDEIRRGFFRDPALSIVPYTRGALYAAELDAALRRGSQRQRTLDDLVRELYRASRVQSGDQGLPTDAVRQLVNRELGRAGAARFDAVIVRGGDPQPAPDAYGPCFTRRPRTPKEGFEWVRVPGLPDEQCRSW